MGYKISTQTHVALGDTYKEKMDKNWWSWKTMETIEKKKEFDLTRGIYSFRKATTE